MAKRKHSIQIGGLFTHLERGETAARKKTALDTLQEVIDWEFFREPLLANLDYKRDFNNPSAGGRPPFDPVLMFKIIVLQRTYDLSDDECELQIYDRRSFQRFLTLEHAGRIPDAKTIWKFRERLGPTGILALFEQFDKHMLAKGLMVQKTKILDAAIVQVPQKRGADPAPGSHPPAEAQRDTEARHTQKHGKTYFGYKNHVKISSKEKLIENYHTSPANLHDSQAVSELVDERDASSIIYADSAYRSAEIEDALAMSGITSRIHQRAYRNRPLTKRQMTSNSQRSKVRSRVEHVFAQLSYRFKANRLRTIGQARASHQIGLGNLIYNFFRYGFLGQSMHTTREKA